MSVEEAVTDGLHQPLDANAQSAEDVKKMLAELKGEKEATKAAVVTAPTEKTNGASEDAEKSEPAPAEQVQETKPAKESESMKDDRDDEHEVRARRRNDRDEGRSSRGGRGGGRGGSFKPKSSYKENIKSDLTTLKETDDPVQIRRQVEFYFSDSNLPMDKFLLGQVGGSKNNPVEIKTLHSFKRMRHFQPFEAIVAALKDSKILEVTNDDTCVRRIVPLPEALDNGPDDTAVKVFEDRAMPRSIYAKGFGEEVPTTQFDIEAFFAPYGPTNAIRLRRSDIKNFKGSVFVEFQDEDLMKKFLELDPKPTFKGQELQIMSKKEYCDQKVEDIKSGKIRANNNYDRDRRAPRNDRGRGDRDYKRKRDDEDDRDWRERREDDRKSGFRDDKRRGGRDRDSRGSGRGGRSDRDRHDRRDRMERDHRGVPIVQETEDKSTENKTKRENATADAIAKAKAMVEAESKKQAEKQSGADVVEVSEQGVKPDAGKTAADVIADIVKADIEEITSKKRSRQDDNENGEPKTKKVDTKSEAAEVVNGRS